MHSRTVFLGAVLAAGAANAQIHVHQPVDFTVALPATGMTVQLPEMTVNLEGADCCLLKAADYPGTARLYHYEYEACDDSPSGSSNLSVLVCDAPAEECLYVANTSTGMSETPGCVTISGPVDSFVDPANARVVLVHTDTDLTPSTRAAAVRLFWQPLPGGIFANGFESGDTGQWSVVVGEL